MALYQVFACFQTAKNPMYLIIIFSTKRLDLHIYRKFADKAYYNDYVFSGLKTFHFVDDCFAFPGIDAHMVN